MPIRYKDENGNLNYTCWNCKQNFNFKGMNYIKHNDGECPKCEAVIKLTK